MSDAPAKKAPRKTRKKAAEAPTTDAAGASPPAKRAPRQRAAKAAAAEAPASAGAAPKPRVEKKNVVIPKETYEPQKDAIKAPFKEHGLKWQFLGEGKGRYHKEGVNVFVQFQDDGIHYALWGADTATVDAILGTWRGILGDAAVAQAEAAGAQAERAQEAAKESEELRLWRLQEPQRRPGEPELFFKKRVAEWEAKRPS